MPKVVKDAGLDVHVLGERVLVRYDVLFALGLLLTLLPHPQVILVRTSTTTRVSVRSTNKVNSVSKLLSRKVQTRGHSLSVRPTDLIIFDANKLVQHTVLRTLSLVFVHSFVFILPLLVLRIRDVYPGIFPSRIPDFGSGVTKAPDPGSGSATKDFSILDPKNCY